MVDSVESQEIATRENSEPISANEQKTDGSNTEKQNVSSIDEQTAKHKETIVSEAQPIKPVKQEVAKTFNPINQTV